MFKIILLILGGFLFSTTPVLANSASVSSNNSTPNADGQTVAVITIDVKDGSGNPVGSGDMITITNTNSDSGLNIIANNSGACGGTSRTTSAQAATGSDGSGSPGNEVQFGVCSTSAGTDNFTVSDSTGNIGSISIVFQPVSVTATPTPTPTGSACNDPAPGSTPVLTSAVSSGDNQVTLTWTDASDPVTNYLVAYGIESGKYIYGNPNIGDQGVTTYTVGSLATGTTYYFVIAANNGCTSGDFSNELSAVPGGLAASSVLSSNSDSAQASQTPSPTDTPVPTETVTPTPSPVPINTSFLSGLNTKSLIAGLAVVVGIIVLGLGFVLIFKKDLELKFKRRRRVPASKNDLDEILPDELNKTDDQSPPQF